MKIILAVSIIIFSFYPAFACSCANTNETQAVKTLKNQAAVFEGEVVEISAPQKKNLFDFGIKKYGPPQEYIRVKFRVLKAWKGIETDSVIIETDNTSCNLDYNVGQVAFVVADGTPLMTGLCERGTVQETKFSDIFGAPKVFPAPSPELPTTQNQPQAEESFWSQIWNRISSLFS